MPQKHRHGAQFGNRKQWFHLCFFGVELENPNEIDSNYLGGGFKYSLFSPLFGEDFPFD